MTSDGALAELPRQLVNDQVLQQLLGQKNAEIAVADAGRAFFVAGLTEISSQIPIVVVTSTVREAETLCDDLDVWLGKERVRHFPAWETLPFERVSPATETMGKRLELLNRLQSRNPPDVVVVPVRALLQRINPEARNAQLLELRRGSRADLSELSQSLVAKGYRREFQVEHRGEFAIRGGILDIFPSTGSSPVRADLWGDEVERLSEFSISNQRSTAEIQSVIIAPARELLPTRQVRERALELLETEPWGREQWERLAAGEFFDGMESWLPWLTSEELILGDMLQSNALVLLLDPKRLRDRSSELIADCLLYTSPSPRD